MTDSSTSQDVQEMFRRKVFQDPAVFLNTANVQPTARIIAHANGYFNETQVRKETSNGGHAETQAESCTDDTDNEQPVHHGFETWLGSEEINDSTDEEESLEIPDGGQELTNRPGHLSLAESCNSLPDSECEENNSISNEDRDLESPNGAEALDRLESSSEETDDDQPVRDRPIPAVERHLGRLRMRKSSASS